MKTDILLKKYLGLLTVLILVFSACNKPKGLIDNNSFTINNNLEELNTRVKIVREPLESSANLKYTDSDGDCDNYTWYLVAEVDSPLFNGDPLSATDVRILGEKAYVTYNKKGDIPAGGVDIIDISDQTAPEISSYMEFNSVDINTLAVDDLGTDASRKLFLAGSGKNGALLRQVTVSNGLFDGGVVDIKLSSYYTDDRITASANGIGLSNEYIYMTSGNTNGGTFQLSREPLEIIAHEEYSSAKAIALNGVNSDDYQFTLIGGEDARLLVYKVGSDRTLVREIELGYIVHQNVDEMYIYAGKAALSIGSGESIAYIAMNSRGAQGINVETGTTVCYSPANMLPYGNTTGVAVDGKTIYLANGIDGLFIGCIPEGTGEISKVQQWGLNDNENSANMVQTDGNWIFLAKGGGGLKILRKVANGVYPAVTAWDDDGRPTPVENTETLCENLIADFNSALPEGEDAKKNRKEYFKNENREIVLTEDAEVSVCFVSEGADYTNTFGYYTYNVENPPKKVNDIKSTMKVIFANASSLGSGGALVEGDCVNLGSFTAGTVIGYFVDVNGWNKYTKKITDGLDTFFTNPRLNKGHRQQSVLMYNGTCPALITAFEDIQNRKGDRDYNDIVVKTNINPIDAMNTANVIQFPPVK